jgi:sugar O-acyltransferase (sialic acid O-acetyltransferase NeuD family)
LVGVESHYIFDVIDILSRCAVPVSGYVRSVFDQEVAGDLPRLCSTDALNAELTGGAFLVPLLTPGRRKRVVDEARGVGLRPHPAVCDPTSVIADSTQIGDGSLINALVTIGPNGSLGGHVSINRNASIGHNCLLDDYASVGPGVTICGDCVLAPGAFIGAGAVIGPKVGIGRNAVVGAGAVVMRDVEAGVMVVGNPATVLRDTIEGYRDIGV